MLAAQDSPVAPEVQSECPPIACLPNEIIHLILSLLRPVNVACLRLTCKAFSIIGLQYLLPELHLIFASSSFEHLREVSNHPVLSQHVQSLFYEADSLLRYDTFGKWKRHVFVPEKFNAPELPDPPSNPTRREDRAYRRNRDRIIKSPRYLHLQKHLKLAYRAFQSHISDQDMIRHHDYNAQMLQDVMFNFRHLKAIELSLERCLRDGPSAKLNRAFSKASGISCGDEGKDRCGVAPLRTLLLGASHAGLEIETLRCGIVHWRFFKQEDDVFKKMKHAVRCLRTLAFYVTSRIEQAGDIEDLYPVEISSCDRLPSRSERLGEFIGAAPHLEDLTINFDGGNPEYPPQLTDFVGKITWHALRIISFTRIRANENDLAHFYERHTSTLRVLKLHNISLQRGSWPLLFQKIRNLLSLKEAKITGKLTSENPGELFFLGSSLKSVSRGDKVAPVRVDLEEYLVQSGEGPVFEFERYDPSDWTYDHIYD